MPFVPCFPAFFALLISLGQQGLIILRFKSGPILGPSRLISYSPIKLLEFSFQPIRKRCCCRQLLLLHTEKPLMRSRVLVLRWIYFASTEEDYCLKGMHFANCRSKQHHSLYKEFPLKRFCSVYENSHLFRPF